MVLTSLTKFFLSYGFMRIKALALTFLNLPFSDKCTGCVGTGTSDSALCQTASHYPLGTQDHLSCRSYTVEWELYKISGFNTYLPIGIFVWNLHVYSG